MHPRNASSTLPNQSRSAKPAGTITSSPSHADFRTPPPPPSNLHSARQPSYPNSRAFLHWRLSDDGPGASRIVSIGRHPKPLYGAIIVKLIRRSFPSPCSTPGGDHLLVPT